MVAAVPARAGTAPLRRKREQPAAWLDGQKATGDWFGVRDDLVSMGIGISADWKGTFYGVMSGGMDSPRGAFDEELNLGLTLDLGKLAGIDGLVLQGGVRYRDGRGANTYVGASSTFSPTAYQSGLGWRLMPFFFTYVTPELFGVRDFLTISGGWQNAYTIFANQPESKFFRNNAITATKGLGGANGFPWSSSYAAWGGYLKIRPTSWSYAMAGLYEAVPEATAAGNHGLDFAGFAQDPGSNGLYFLAETGVTPRLGPGKLPGKYAFGTIYWGLENASFCGETYDQKFAFYWQASQMLFREPSHAAPDFKEAAPVAAAECEQGLQAFTFFTYAPSYDNALPFYFHAGLLYTGLIPGRDEDVAGVAFAYGNYSYDRLVAERDAGRSVHQTSEAVIEADYRVQLTHFLYAQPFWQTIIRPNGTGQVPNAHILGMQVGVNF